jgi:hypothetical protein
LMDDFLATRYGVQQPDPLETSNWEGADPKRAAEPPLA